MVKTRSTDKPASSAPRGKEAIAAYTRRIGAYQTLAAIVILAGLWYGWETQAVPRLGLNRLHVHTMADRFTFTLRHQLPGIIAVAASILHVSLTRLTTVAINPLSNNEHLVEVASRILGNTVEQYLLNAVNQLILSTHVNEAHLKIIPLLSVTFLLGRILFAVGYIRSPAYRTLGFVITFLPTLAILGYNIYFSWALGFTHHLGGGVSASSARG